MNNSIEVSQRDALDIVFANRNRAYGAYPLRRGYAHRLGRALILGLLFITAMIAAPFIASALEGVLDTEEERIIKDDLPRELTKVEVILPPKVTPPPSPVQRYVPPVVLPNEQVPEEQPQDVQTIMDDPRDVGAQDVAGEPEGPPTIDPGNNGLGVVEVPKPEDDDPVEPFAVNKMPNFPGGEAAMFKWLMEHFKYPEQAREAGIGGQVVLSFVVGKDGGITDVQVLKTPAGGAVLAREAIRVVNLMPRWSPGEANGHPVKVRFTLPFRIELQD